MDTKRNHYNTVFFYLLSNLLLLFMLEMQRNTEDLSFFSHRCCCRASKGIFYTCPIGTRRHKRLSVLSVYGGPVRHKCLRSSIFLLCMPCQYETNYHQSGRAGKFPLGGSAWAGGRVGSVAVTHKRCVCVFEVGVCVRAFQFSYVSPFAGARCVQS
jgi:hypothetical protein